MQQVDLTWGLIHLQVAVINAVQDVVDVSLLPHKAAGVFLLVEAVKEKAGLDRALLRCSLHKRDIAPGLFAAGRQAVSVPIQLGRREERRSVFHRLVGIENKILLAVLEFVKTLSRILAPAGVQGRHEEQERKRAPLSIRGWIHILMCRKHLHSNNNNNKKNLPPAKITCNQSALSD